jgi:uncharacterized protein (DUF1697 family)
MKTYIALLRGINVSGHNSIKMADLKQLLAKAGLKNVVTYIQSGNIIFNSFETNKNLLEELISEKIKGSYNYEIKALVISKTYLDKVFRDNPLVKKSNIDFKKVCVTFLTRKPNEEDILKVFELKTKDEQIIIKNKTAYLYCPNGLGNTKLSNNNIEVKLKVSATSRNWNTITKLVELSNQ